MEERISRMPHRPNTPAGQIAYANDILAWNRCYADLQVTVTTGYPLTPGTAPVGSGDCWGCGLATIPRHSAASCTASLRVPWREKNWRRIAYNVLKHRNQPQPVNVVQFSGHWYDDEQYTPSSPADLGNGDGVHE